MAPAAWASSSRLLRWRLLTASTLIVAYAGYYLCRSNLAVVAPLLVADPATGLSRTSLGLLTSAGVLAYAIGKLLTGIAGDVAGGRALLLAGMFGSALATGALAAGHGPMFFLTAWISNRFVQSGGWNGLVKLATHWFDARVYGRVMAILSLSYLFGDAVARVLLGQLLVAGWGWRAVFAASGAVMLVLAVLTAWLLHSSPRDLGLPEPAVHPANVHGSAGASSRPPSLRGPLIAYVREPAFLRVCALSVGLTLIREAFNLWVPTYLVDAHGLSPGRASQWSALFPFVGGIATILTGVLSDRGATRLALAWPALVAGTAALFLLATPLATASLPLSVVAIGCVALCVLGPYSLLAGAVAMDFGGRIGSATAAGAIDGAGYLGAALSGLAVGAALDAAGWPAVFVVLALVTAGSALLVRVHTGRATSPTPRVVLATETDMP